MRDLLLRALSDTERGYGDRPISISDDALSHLADTAGGDARTALNALELAVESTPPDEQGVIDIDDTVAEESIQQQGRTAPAPPKRHSYEGHWVAQQYLPDLHKGRRFYNPSAEGYEAEVKARVERWRAREE